MSENPRPRNPYIAGRALGQENGFCGREDIFGMVETELLSPDRNAIVLFGQRRIGKTSILLQLQHRLPSPPFLPVYFDLMDRAHRPMGTVLFELASAIASKAGLEPPAQSRFDDEGSYFRREILPKLYEKAGEKCRPVLLLDEFDVLDVAAEEKLSPSAAAQAFFPYLRQLIEGEPRLGFIFVVGRKAEELSIDVKATFKAARYKRVSVLDQEDARELVYTAQQQGTLTFTDAAVDRILSLTACHPYFTQLLCQLLWDGAYASSPQEAPVVEAQAVDAMIPKAIEAGQNILEWIWDGLPPAERVLFSAVATATEEETVVTQEQLLDILQRHGIRMLTRELELAPETLVEWQMLKKIGDGYGFFIDLMRRWVEARKPLPKVKDELDRIVPLAYTLYQSADGFYRQSDLENAESLARQALKVNPNHLKARLLLGQILVEQDKLNEAVREMEEAYKYDEQAARHPLIRALLMQGEKTERTGAHDDALKVYERVLELSPRERVAQERIAEIAAARAQVQEQQGQIDKAAETYQLLATQFPAEARWQEALQRVQAIRQLERRYNEGIGAFKQGDRRLALQAFADVIHIEPDYKDAAELLASVVQGQKRKGVWDTSVSRLAAVIPAFLITYFACTIPGVLLASYIEGTASAGTFAGLGVASLVVFTVIGVLFLISMLVVLLVQVTLSRKRSRQWWLRE